MYGLCTISSLNQCADFLESQPIVADEIWLQPTQGITLSITFFSVNSALLQAVNAVTFCIR
jgi:hypothetical protein